MEGRPSGDVNDNGAIDIKDAFDLLDFLFAAGPVPEGSGDVNGDGAVNGGDALYLINRFFAGGPDAV